MTEKKGWFARLKDGLKRTSQSISDGIVGIFTKKPLDQETLDELEELLIAADLGVGPAGRVVDTLKKTRFGKEVSPEEVREALAEEIAGLLAPVAVPLAIEPAHRPHVILVVGVNGSGKTTTIGKLAKSWADQGKTVVIAACDTFRAAAIDQLKVWGARAGVEVMSRESGADSAGLAFDALKSARERNADVLLIDTAGRLQNKKDLMAELDKIRRVIAKQDPTSPHSTLLVLDATTGQNALRQVEVFRDVARVSGLIMTKLDGTARGGILVALADKFALPVHAIGVGEQAEDLQSFDPKAFARALVGTS
ncbi:signal recognition particle-docking protein FtsY [Desertibaculum subflavum]|uniref:signal recognition particle-docking protein FtsY n=1 Tax=Desertibaculum subflavum TaxID=2268458 RepID=UPI000E674240